MYFKTYPCIKGPVISRHNGKKFQSLFLLFLFSPKIFYIWNVPFSSRGQHAKSCSIISCLTALGSDMYRNISAIFLCFPENAEVIRFYFCMILQDILKTYLLLCSLSFQVFYFLTQVFILFVHQFKKKMEVVLYSNDQALNDKISVHNTS